jgi:hypothetical protein
MVHDPERTLHMILKTCHSTDPSRMRKAELLALRTEIIRLSMLGINTERPPKPRYCKPDDNYMHAVRLVSSYDGDNAFMQSLKRGLDAYGGLTTRQVDAVLEPPNERDIVELQAAGIEPESVTYHFQALDFVRAHRRQLRQAR